MARRKASAKKAATKSDRQRRTEERNYHEDLAMKVAMSYQTSGGKPASGVAVGNGPSVPASKTAS